MLKSEKKSQKIEEEESKKEEFVAKYKLRQFIIQKYIERPLLIDQRKFDIRVWVFLDHKGTAYFCKQGYLRTSSAAYEMDDENPDNQFVHLTNIAVQKNAADYGKGEEGNILSFEQFESQMTNNKKFNMEDIVFKMKQ